MFVGIDVAKATVVVACDDERVTRTYPNTPAGIAALCAALPTASCTVAMEATGRWELAVAWALADAGATVWRLNPQQARDAARGWGQRTKTDAVDARGLARLAGQLGGTPPPLPTPQLAALREWWACRQDLVAARTRLKQQHQTAQDPEVRACYAAQLATLAEHLAVVDRRLAEAFAADATSAREEALLQTMPGVGPQSARVTLLLCPEIKTATAKQLASLVGVAPHAQDSGTRRGARHCAGGRATLRRALWMAAVSARRHNPTLRAFADRLAAQGKPAKVILVAVLHKLLRIMQAILKSGQPWELRPQTP